MSIQVFMPALSPTMQEGKLAKWLVREGDMVAAGEVIAEIETDKATMEVEAADEGRLGRILIPAGTEKVKIHTPIAVIIKGVETTTSLMNDASLSQNGAATVQSDAVPLSFITTSFTADAGSSASDSTSASDTSDDLEIASDAETVTITMREALRDAMAEEMRTDERVFLMGEEVAQYQGAYKVSQGLLDEFGDKRVIDTPITEHGFAGVGVGSAFGGLRPIVEFMTWNFAMQAIDQLVNSAAKTLYMSGGQMRCPIVFRGPNGAASRVAAQHSQDYSAWYAHVPGLKVIAPSTPADAKGLLKAAIRDPNPVVFLENELLYGVKGEVPTDADWTLPIGKARIVRKGRDVTIVSFARGMVYALGAANQLAESGVDAEVIDLRTLRPLDIATVVASVKRTNRLVTVEETWPVCSIGSEICARVVMEAFDYLDAPPAKVSAADVPLPYAANLEKLALPSIEQVIEVTKSVLYR
ncbi:MAG: pyruvate dehydrogenase complex E1 component subunit beta [Alphaproteobacteria bacterium]